MNRVASILSPARINPGLADSSRTGLFEEAGRLFAAHGGLDPAQVVASLCGREELGSTALGQGVAIPHARVKGLRQALAGFIRLRPPIAFDAPDGKPVSEALILLVPGHATEEHLQMLAEAAQMFSDRRFRDHLREQGDAEGIRKAFADWPRIGP